MTATLTVGGSDVSSVTPYDVTVQAGRDSIDSQPDASVMDATVHGWRAAGRLGDPVVLSDVHGPMFHGTVTDLKCQLDPDTTHAWTTRLTAVGPLADLGRVVVGDEPWPEEMDSARIARILDVAGAPAQVDPAVLGPSMLPRDVDSKPALELAQEVAADALGVLWEQPADPTTPIRYIPQRLRAWGEVAPTWGELPPAQRWSDLPAARTWQTWTNDLAPQTLTVDARYVVADMELGQQVGDLVRRARVVYGTAPDSDTPRPQAALGEGTPEVSRETQIADETGALTVADTLWRSRREPAWRMNSLTLALSEMPPAEAATVRARLAVGTKLVVEHIDFDSPVGTTWQGYVEGWTHELADGDHRLVLRTVERRMIEPADRWQDIPPATRWNTIPATLKWQDTAGGF